MLALEGCAIIALSPKLVLVVVVFDKGTVQQFFGLRISLESKSFAASLFSQDHAFGCRPQRPEFLEPDCA